MMMGIFLNNDGSFTANSGSLITTPKGIVSFETEIADPLTLQGKTKRIYLDTSFISLVEVENGDEVVTDLETFIKTNLNK